MKLFKLYNAHVSRPIFYTDSNESIFTTLGHHLHNLGGQVEQGLEGVHHVDGEVVQTMQCTCFKANFYAESIKSIFRTLGHYLHNLSGQV